MTSHAIPIVAVSGLVCLAVLAGTESEPGVRFENTAAAAGLKFVLDNGATPEKFQIETMAGGLAVMDYNNDGLPDIYFTNGARMPAMEKDSPRFFNRLFRNKGNGVFDDVTLKARVQGRGFCTGAAAGDYDNDGFQDLFLTCNPENILYRNRGDGTFEDVTKRAGVATLRDQNGRKLWSVAAGWFDYDNDGHLDLFISNYCDWSPQNNPYCGDESRGVRVYCDPRQFKGEPNALFHNNGDGTFTNVSQRSGIAAVLGYGMGVAFADFNRDGKMDVFVANDTVRNLLFENRGDAFREVALPMGVGYAENGETVSGMGADFRDFNNDGFPDLFMTALSSETWPLFLNRNGKDFRNITFSSKVGTQSVGMSGWCNGIFDLDNDGLKDLIAVRSHVFDNSMAAVNKPYAEPNALFLNATGEQFQDASANAGEDFRKPAARRGCGFADFDGDGTIDMVTSVIGSGAELFLNRPARPANWVELRLIGRRDNRDGIGAEVKITEPSGRVQYNHATTSVGYASSSSRTVHFGLANSQRLDSVEVRWPSGITQSLQNVAVNRVITIEESNADH